MWLIFREILKNVLPYTGAAAIGMMFMAVLAGVVSARSKDRLLVFKRAKLEDLPGLFGNELDKLRLNADKLTPEQQSKHIGDVLTEKGKNNSRLFIFSIIVFGLIALVTIIGLFLIYPTQKSALGSSSDSPIPQSEEKWQIFLNKDQSSDTDTGVAYNWPYCGQGQNKAQPCHMLLYSHKEKSDLVTETTVEYDLPTVGIPLEARLTIRATMNDKREDDRVQTNDCKVMLVINDHYPAMPFPTKGIHWGKSNGTGEQYFINFEDITNPIPKASELLVQGINKIKYSLKCDATKGFIVIKQSVLEVRIRNGAPDIVTSSDECPRAAEDCQAVVDGKKITYNRDMLEGKYIGTFEFRQGALRDDYDRVPNAAEIRKSDRMEYFVKNHKLEHVPSDELRQYILKKLKLQSPIEMKRRCLCYLNMPEGLFFVKADLP